MHDYVASKRALRRHLRAGVGASVTSVAALDATGGHPHDPAQSVVATRISLFARQLLGGCQRIGLYVALPHEVDTQPLTRLLRRDGRSLYLPRTLGHGRQAKLAFAPWQAGDALQRHAGGMLEPQAGAGAAITCDQLDAVVVPGVGFDLRGGRLGQGWGCYDRTLANYRGLVVALAHARQICAAVPHEGHDRRVDVVITPFGVWPTFMRTR